MSTCRVGKVSQNQSLHFDLSHVVEVPVRDGLLLGQLSDLVEQVVQLVPGLRCFEQTWKKYLGEIIFKLQLVWDSLSKLGKNIWGKSISNCNEEFF